MIKSLKTTGMAVVLGGSLTFAGAMANATNCCSCSPKSDSSNASSRASTQNPGSPVNSAIEGAVERSLVGMQRVTGVHAAEESDLFQYPAFFTEYGYSKVNDDRPAGIETTSHTLTLGMDFVTAFDLFVGGMVSYTDFDGDIDDAVEDDEGDAVTFTLYGSKALNQCTFAGISLTYSDDDSDLGTDTDTYAIAPYLSYLINLDNVKISITPTYALSIHIP